MAARASAGLLKLRWNLFFAECRSLAPTEEPFLADRCSRAACNSCLALLLRGVGDAAVVFVSLQGSGVHGRLVDFRGGDPGDDEAAELGAVDTADSIEIVEEREYVDALDEKSSAG